MPFEINPPQLHATFFALHDEMDAKITLVGPSFFHLECVAELIKEISKNAGVKPHEMLVDLARLL